METVHHELRPKSVRANGEPHRQDPDFCGIRRRWPWQVIGQIDLDQQVRFLRIAQALLFGPHGLHYVPISGPVIGPGQPVANLSVGEVRRYNVHSKK